MSPRRGSNLIGGWFLQICRAYGAGRSLRMANKRHRLHRWARIKTGLVGRVAPRAARAWRTSYHVRGSGGHSHNCGSIEAHLSPALSPCCASGEGEIWAARMEVSRLCVPPEPKCQTPVPSVFHRYSSVAPAREDARPNSGNSNFQIRICS